MAEGVPIGALAVRIGADATDLIDGFKKAEKAADTFGGKLGETARSLTGIGTAAAAAGGAVFLMVKGLADSADEAGKTAQKVGMTVEAYSSMSYAAKIANVSNEQLTTGLKQLSKFMVENNVVGVSTEEQLLRIADQFANAADDAGKTAVAMKYFGRSGADLIPFLNQGRAGIEELRKEAHKLGVVITNDAAKAAGEFNDNLAKIEAISKGVAMEIGGPLVKALADAAGKFVEARKEGEGFFSAMQRGIQELLTGSDSDKWAKQFSDATDIYMNALNKMDRVRKGRKVEELMPSERAMFEREAKAAANAKAEIERLRAIQPLIALEPSPDKPKPTATIVPPQTKEQISEAEKRAQEVRDAMHKVREADDKRELDQIAAQNKAKEAAEIQAMEQRLLLREQELQNESELLKERFEARKSHEEDLTKLGYTHRQIDLNSARTFFGSMAMLMQTNSKKQFEIGKAAAIAETIINTHTMAVGAYRALASIPYVGPYLGAAAAAAAVAFGASQVQAIRSQSFGGGGSVAAPVVASNPSTGAPVGTPADVGGGGNRGPDTIIHLHGDTFGRKQLRGLIEQINEEGRDGGRVVLAGRD